MLIGKSRDEVVSIIGIQDNKGSSNTWFYYIGMKPGFTLGPDYLEIEFSHDKVVSCRTQGG